MSTGSSLTQNHSRSQSEIDPRGSSQPYTINTHSVERWQLVKLVCAISVKIAILIAVERTMTQTGGGAKRCGDLECRDKVEKPCTRSVCLEGEKDFNDDHREEIIDCVQLIPGFQECDEDVETWMAYDAEDCGFKILNDDEIVTSVQEESDPVDDEADEDENNNNNESSKGLSNADVFSALETTMEWYEQQSECCSTQLLLFKRIRDLAAKKRRCVMVQRKISGYFPQ
ncbi:hypothetical protein TNCV_4545591 [Trichonephila clavipes]|nr:hypothetical protein TNCV_4545591 [Trichonephila clavipes]